MRQPGKYKKILLALGLVLVILIGGTVGAYYYTLHKYARQITDMLYLLSQLEPGEANGAAADPASPAPGVSPDAQPAEQDGALPGAAPLQQRPEEAKSPAPAPASPPAPPKEQGETATREALPPGFQEKVLKDNAHLIRKVDVKDQLYAMQIIKRFSAPELQKMYHLYQEGGASRGRLLELLQERLAEAEIIKIRDIAAKYRDLLA